MIGARAFTVWTIETGINRVALWDDKCPTNWNIPMGRVVRMIREVGVMNCLIEQISCGAKP